MTSTLYKSTQKLTEFKNNMLYKFKNVYTFENGQKT
jgi:hypothetical protein